MTMPGSTWLILSIGAFTMVVDWFVMRALIRTGWGTLAEKFPPQPVAPDAVRRDFQSFSFDFYGFGGCVHAAADSAHLHLFPAAFLRWLGCRPMSIPWDRIALKSRRRSKARAAVAGITLKGPAWSCASPIRRPHRPTQRRSGFTPSPRTRTPHAAGPLAGNPPSRARATR